MSRSNATTSDEDEIKLLRAQAERNQIGHKGMFVVGKLKNYGTHKDRVFTLSLTQGERYKAKLQITLASGLEVFAYKCYESGTFVEGYIPGPWEDHLNSLYEKKLLPVKGYADKDSIQRLKNEEKIKFGL